MKSSNTTWHHATVTRDGREKLHNHRGVVVWFTGLSGSGKSTLAHAVEEKLHMLGCHTFVLDGDNVRHGLCADLGFSQTDRTENIRRVGETSKLFVEAGTIILTAFISPFRNDRDRIKKLLDVNDFMEIYCQCPVSTCEERDVKGLYKLAREGHIAEFTGISSPYEEPLDPKLVINTESTSLERSVEMVVELLKISRVIHPK
ncbi:adenylylsulfate kinase [Massilia sp. MP_M2]|uniref:adenylyl-sulfate kinase n=1 Tax=Massilia sp. MP_M2 TaxID=3071713 RepID=UPI00319EB66C